MINMNRALTAVLGNRSATYVLLHLQQYGEGHGSQIARTYGVSATGIQRQLRRLEDNGVLTSRLVGRTRLFSLNDKEPTVAALQVFLTTEITRAASETVESLDNAFSG